MVGTQNRVSPIVAIAAVAVIIFSAVGIGVMTGIIPNSFSKGADRPASAEPTTGIATPQPADEAQTSAIMPATTRGGASRAAAAEAPATTQGGTSRVAAAEAPAAQPGICADCGKVTTIEVVERPGEGTGLGAVAGGVVGGVLGNQIGRGTGRKLATVAGAAGGAYVGHQAEKSMKTTKRWDVAVRMENGATRRFSFDQDPVVRVGDYVKVRDGKLFLN